MLFSPSSSSSSFICALFIEVYTRACIQWHCYYYMAKTRRAFQGNWIRTVLFIYLFLFLFIFRIDFNFIDLNSQWDLIRNCMLILCGHRKSVVFRCLLFQIDLISEGNFYFVDGQSTYFRFETNYTSRREKKSFRLSAFAVVSFIWLYGWCCLSVVVISTKRNSSL